MATEDRGTIAFFSVYRSPLPLDIFSCQQKPLARSLRVPIKNEVQMTDGESYNYNGQVIPSPALKTILKRLNSASKSQGTEEDVDSGRLSGIVFVSERAGNLETLHISLRFDDNHNPPTFQVFSLAEVFGTSSDAFDGVRMEDSGSIAGDYLVYVSTKEPAERRRQPWTAVYKTNLKTGETDRLTPPGIADLSPSVSPSGKKIAVASFQLQGGWDGQIDISTDIYVMNVEGCDERKLVVEDAGWPTWGSDDVLFFHRKNKVVTTTGFHPVVLPIPKRYGVFRANISDGSAIPAPGTRVTPKEIDARTPAAIDATRVAVATIRKPSNLTDVREEAQYRHIEIFDSTDGKFNIQITQNTRPKADHFNPFVIDGGSRMTPIGYHRCMSENLTTEDHIQGQFQKLDSPDPHVGLLRVPGVFPTISPDGSQLAFVDNEFKAVWVADSKDLRVVYQTKDEDKFFSPVWNKKPKSHPNRDYDIQLYVCNGKSFNATGELNICGITYNNDLIQLTKGHNDAFPSTNPQGTKLVFRSTRREEDNPKKHKNLYITDAKVGEYQDGGEPTRLTKGDWTDTHCQWSPSGDWIVFSSSRYKPETAPELDNGLDPGYFAVFLVIWNKPEVLVRVMYSGDDIARHLGHLGHPGHVNHPIFSPDGKSIVVVADLAAVSADPTSLPLINHSARPYGDIFTIDIDPDDIYKNEDVKDFKRMTHSRYENSTATWTMFSTEDPNAKWKLTLQPGTEFRPSCPFAYSDGGESWHMTGHLCIRNRLC